jgi:hypothetical protein
VEAYAGDTPTLAISDVGRDEKKQREAAALARLAADLNGVYPWITETIVAYERLDCSEARFVKVMDKIMPKVTHLLNGGTTLIRSGLTNAELTHTYNIQLAEIEASYGYDQPEAMALYRAMRDRVLAQPWAQKLTG